MADSDSDKPSPLTDATPAERELGKALGGKEPVVPGFGGKIQVKAPSKITLAEPDDSFVPLQETQNLKRPLTMFPQGSQVGQGGLTPENIAGLMNIIRPYVSGVAGGVAGSFTPGGPITGIPAGIAAYTAADIAQKYATPEERASLGEELADSTKEGLINEIGGRIFQGIGAGVKALRSAGVPDPNSILKLYPTTSQALENYGWHKLASLSKFSEDFGAPAAKSAALDKAGGEGFTQALLLSNRMNSSGRFTKNVFQDPAALQKKILDTLDQGINKNPTPGQFQTGAHYASQEAYDLLNGSSTPFEALDDVLASKDKLNKVLSVGQAVGPKNLNVRKDLQAYYWNRIFDDATTFSAPGKARIDPDKINQLWFNPKTELRENLETLYGKQNKDNLDQFMKNILDTQDKQSLLPGVGGKLKYMGGGFALTGLLGSLTGAATAGKLVSGLYLTNAAMGRLLTNPATSKAVLSLVGAQPLGQGEKLIARGVFNALEGSRVALLNNDGSKTWGGVIRSPEGSYEFQPEK